LLKFEIFYNDAEQYPRSSGIVTLDDCDGFEGIADEATAIMNSNSHLPSLLRWLCDRLKIPLVIETTDSISQTWQPSDEAGPSPFTRHNSNESTYSADSWSSDQYTVGTYTVGIADYATASRRATADLEDVRRHGYGGGILPGSYYLPVWLSLDLSQLRLHPETAAAWRADPAATLLITGRFHATYPSPASPDELDLAAAAEPFRVRIVRPDPSGRRWWEAGAEGGKGDGGDGGDGGGDGGGFGLQWTLNDRLKSFFRILAAQVCRVRGRGAGAGEGGGGGTARPGQGPGWCPGPGPAAAQSRRRAESAVTAARPAPRVTNAGPAAAGLRAARRPRGGGR
jgi:hypothetical protein